jgi:hypothetical protein
VQRQRDATARALGERHDQRAGAAREITRSVVSEQPPPITLPFTCPPSEPSVCLLAITLLGAHPHASTSTAAKAKPILLGKAAGSVKPGTRKTINIKLFRAGRTFVKPHRDDDGNADGRRQ